MTHLEPGTAGPLPPPGLAEGATVDPELLALPAPPRARRVVAMVAMAFVAATSLGVLAGLRLELTYFLHGSGTPVDLGEATALDGAMLASNEYVRVRGMPMLSGMITAGRVVGSSETVVFPLAGQRTIFVERAVDGRGDLSAMASREFTGRLVRFEDLGVRYESVRRALGAQLGTPLSPDAALLVVDAPPGSFAWVIAVIAFCVFVLVLDVSLLLRWFRPLPAAES